MPNPDTSWKNIFPNGLKIKMEVIQTYKNYQKNFGDHRSSSVENPLCGGKSYLFFQKCRHVYFFVSFHIIALGFIYIREGNLS